MSSFSEFTVSWVSSKWAHCEIIQVSSLQVCIVTIVLAYTFTENSKFTQSCLVSEVNYRSCKAPKVLPESSYCILKSFKFWRLSRIQFWWLNVFRSCQKRMARPDHRPRYPNTIVQIKHPRYTKKFLDQSEESESKWHNVKSTSGPISSLESDIMGRRLGSVDYLGVILIVWVLVGYLGLCHRFPVWFFVGSRETSNSPQTTLNVGALSGWILQAPLGS